ncbi:MAG: amidophosphoribosyltransferase [Elusimicrobia bacterium RIFCSPLOWO2_01_FULL_59_12]|nr:MAG: amidophosphoribosyltransferase [Elusimicrobia bacterium RIFCSPLOWO2_01_FULL_59_12]
MMNERDDEHLRDACGVMGVQRHPEAARLCYLGLYALQHRGQESGGIVASDGQKLVRHVEMGLVADIFDKAALEPLKGSLAIGHVRYSTAGGSSLSNAQPLLATTTHGTLAVAHNGNLTNALTLRRQLEASGSIFQTTADSEVLLHLVARSTAPTLREAIVKALRQVEGAYSLVFCTKKELIAARDPYGVRPLALGRLGKAIVVASETCAFDLIGAKYVREVKPGELLYANGGGVKSFPFAQSPRQAHCSFENIYFSRPDGLIFGKSVYMVRKELGRQLAREAPAKADLVIAVPDSANVAAVGYAEESGIPYGLGLIRSHYIGRTFIEPKQSIRDFGARIKYNAVPEALREKRIVLVDDSIVRGTTSRKLVRMLRRAGVRAIHMRISSPPIVGSCYYGIDTPTKKELIAATHSVDQISGYLGVDSLAYLSVKGLLKACGGDQQRFCVGCFTDQYPIPLMDFAKKDVRPVC